jgi:hypothetical protein
MPFSDFTSTQQSLDYQGFAGIPLYKTPIFTSIFKGVEVKFLSPNLLK